MLQPDPSLTEQYEYAAEHDIKCLIIITEAGLAQTGLIKVVFSVIIFYENAVLVFIFIIL